MKKKIFILVTVILAVIGIAIISIPINNEKIIILKGNIFWGKKKCYELEVATCDIVERKCKLCNGKFEGSSSEILCNSCCSITNRCSVCGKIKGNEFIFRG